MPLRKTQGGLGGGHAAACFAAPKCPAHCPAPCPRRARAKTFKEKTAHGFNAGRHKKAPRRAPFLLLFSISFVRANAAATASIAAARRPARSSACTPAMVLPAGLHTSSFSWPGCRPLSSASAAAPSTAPPHTSAPWRGHAASTAPSASASINICAQAPTQPEITLPASIRPSSITSNSPAAASRVHSSAAWAPLACSFFTTSVMPLPMAQGVLGIMRTMGHARPAISARRASESPAAMLTRQNASPFCWRWRSTGQFRPKGRHHLRLHPQQNILCLCGGLAV